MEHHSQQHGGADLPSDPTLLSAEAMDMDDNSDNNDDDQKERLERYLIQLIRETYALCDDNDDIPMIQQTASIEELLTQLAQALMTISKQPSLLNAVYQDNGASYKLRKLDALRNLLRQMAPVAMDVLVRIPSTPNVCLMGLWLRVASQLEPHVRCHGLVLPTIHTHTDALIVLECLYSICQFFRLDVNEPDTFRRLWKKEDWKFLSKYVYEYQESQPKSVLYQCRWYAVRIWGTLLDWDIDTIREFRTSMNVLESNQPWRMHPWDYDQEGYETEVQFWSGHAVIASVRVPVPTSRHHLPLHPSLVCIADHYVFFKNAHAQSENGALIIETPTTRSNLAALVRAVCDNRTTPPPILIKGGSGSGKTTLVRHLAKRLGHEILELQIDEESDAKTLVGSCMVSDIGEFEYRPGALTLAVRTGQWVLWEDFENVSKDIQASLQMLFKERSLYVNNQYERAHPDFRMFAITSNGRVLHPNYWMEVELQVLPIAELEIIATGLYPDLPEAAITATLQIFQELNVRKTQRDFFKVLSRISMLQLSGFITEQQRKQCLAESIDVFVANLPDKEMRSSNIKHILMPAWEIVTHGNDGIQVHLHDHLTEIGRVRIPVPQRIALSDGFALTGSSLRLMESIAACVRQKEPTLLVGETGTAKTTTLQQLAKLLGRELLVQNLSLQTDSTDLLGGYKPLEIRHVSRKIYDDFVDLFTGTFSRRHNADFLSFAADAFNKGQWKKLSQCFRRAAKLGLNKLQSNASVSTTLSEWNDFGTAAERFEQQRVAAGTGLAFHFSEGALVDAIRKGKWILLDEINLASSETLQRICGLLDDATSSLTLTERGDLEATRRHQEFRLFAAMNPATDSGKKDLPPTMRSRFTEIFVDEIVDPVELRLVAAKYLTTVLPASGRPPELCETIVAVVELYLQCRDLSDRLLVDGSGQKPRYTLRTLTRALTASRNMVLQQKFSLHRALYEGFLLSFQGPLDDKSLKSVKKVVQKAFGKSMSKRELDHPGRRPGGKSSATDYTLIKPFWITSGPVEPVDWAEEDSSTGKSRFVLIPSTAMNLRRLARAIAAGPWPVLLEGPTSTGKTTLVEYIAARCGHHVVRINNHEHTDIQEYTGGFSADSEGKLSFQDGLLVQGLRVGHWVILDELNLAPSEVLEALNRLLDDNRELYLPETNETVKPHPNFRLFATQNPSGTYGGRKPLSRAFRNRFVEIQVEDIPGAEMVTIVEKRCGCPPSHARTLVDVMEALRKRRSKSSVFLGKDGLITPRDLLRWAGRGAATKLDLAREGYMLLAERLRSDQEKSCVRDIIEAQMKVTIDIDSFYYGSASEARAIITKACSSGKDHLQKIAPTKSLLRLVSVLISCLKRREPVLLVGETGCGKTMAIELLATALNSTLQTVNCHQTTETSDLLGGLRPIRGRSEIARQMRKSVNEIVGRLAKSEEHRGVSLSHFSWKGGFTDDAQPKGDELTSMYAFVEEIRQSMLADTRSDCSDSSEEPESKRRKTHDWTLTNIRAEIETHLTEFGTLYRRYNALFEWEDGPLVQAMKRGNCFLLDEMSLAEDAVLERLNSVLEPSRTLVLAEKGNNEGSSQVVVARDTFNMCATMNPGGDFGKRELSPALRSRFTEVWVPSVTDADDVGLVVGSALSDIESAVTVSALKRRVLEYISWFNDVLCGDSSSPFSDLALSLRDILTWAQFITVSGSTNNVWFAYMHGACLMHLDGMGLGTALSIDDATVAKKKAESFVLNQLRQEGIVDYKVEASGFGVVQDKFGADPFWIATGRSQPRTGAFNFEAPTTALNVMRVLRAMQLRKPILLEGPPGVGKTTLIAALAEASGHNLVRINLSEQTDMADLIGSDLPVPDALSTETSFAWFDGVLLAAVKRGDWVLLDELNLASQTVLEGLNSCLDHRSEVYVPELGVTVKCPSSFRVFAAQNPLGQGGGRKGLPKSFLNRFTKVFVDSLSEYDLRMILRSQFPSLEAVDAMIDFNCGLQSALTHSAGFGRSGSPWEFNLRDIFRWCHMVIHDSKGDAPESFVRCAVDLYSQRFRTPEDRGQVRQLLMTSMGATDFSPRPTIVDISDAIVRIGDVSLRSRNGSTSSCDLPRHETRFYPHLLEAMGAVAKCISRGWPTLLVGGPSSGKTSLVRMISTCQNSALTELSLSTSTDVSELIGCFEQVDSCETILKTAIPLARLLSGILASGRLRKYHEEFGESVFAVQALQREPPEAIQTKADKCLGVLTTVLKGNETELSVEQHQMVIDLVQKLRESLSTQRPNAVRFEWRDGPIVEAMTSGKWLLLKNVNLCPSSVLDRLNSIMEPDGSLLLAECGCKDGGPRSSSREIQCHPNFRLFLAMDPEFGEVSRALRNRCVEIFLAACPRDGWSRDFAARDTHSSASTDFSRDQTKHMTLHHSSLFHRGLHFTERRMHTNQEQVPDPVYLGPQDSSEWALCSETTQLCWDSRLVRLVSSHGTVFPRYIEEIVAYAKPLGSRTSKDGWSTKLQRVLLALLVAKRADGGSLPAFHVFARRLQSQLRESVVFMLSVTDAYLSHQQSSPSGQATTEAVHTVQKDTNAELMELFIRRLPQLLTEYFWREENASSKDYKDPQRLSLLGISFFVATGKIDRSSLQFPLSPYLWALFQGLDAWIEEYDFVRLLAVDRVRIADLKSLLSDRDTLWSLLRDTPLHSSDQYFLGFDEAHFLVAWQRLRRSIRTIGSKLRLIPDAEIDERASRLNLTMNSIDSVIYDHINAEGEHSGSIAGRISKALVPRDPISWITVLKVRQLIFSSNYDLEKLEGHQLLSLKRALSHRHPIVYVDNAARRQMLGVLTTLVLGSVKEFLPRLGKEFVSVSASLPLVLDHHLATLKESFSSEIEFLGTLHSSESPSTPGCFSADELACKMASHDANGNRFGRLALRLMERFAGIQLASCFESFCEQEEQFLVSKVCRMCLSRTSDSARDQLAPMRNRIENFIDLALSKTLWSATDLLPYQILLWVAESESLDDAVAVKLIRSLLPIIMCVASKRTRIDCVDTMNSVSLELVFPIFFGDTECEDEMRDKRKIGRRNSLVDTLVFSLYGDTLSLASYHLTGTKFATLENYFARVGQSQELARLVSLHRRPGENSVQFQIGYLLSEVLVGLKDTVPQAERNRFSILATDPWKFCKLDDESIKSLLLMSTHETFLAFVDEVVFPLIKCFTSLCGDPRIGTKSRVYLGQARVYLGLLRYHLLIPDSPLDPGKEPMAKMDLIDSQLEESKIALAATELHSAWNYGTKDTRATRLIKKDCSLLETERQKEKTNVIERPLDSSPFYQLYSETLGFSRDHINLSTVLSLLEILSPEHDGKMSPQQLQRIDMFRSTTKSFSSRLLSKFSSYDDVVYPLISSIGFVNDGIRVLVDEKMSRFKNDDLNLPPSFIEFPTVSITERLPELMVSIRAIDARAQNAMEVRCRLTLGFLSLLTLRGCRTDLRGDVLRLWHRVMKEMNLAPTAKSDWLESGVGVEDEEEEFRKQFPDHKKEFEELHSVDDDDTEKLDVRNEDFPVDALLSEPLPREFIESLCFLHSRLLLKSRDADFDASVCAKSFRLRYDAARTLHESGCSFKEFPVQLSGHYFAISLCLPPTPSIASAEGTCEYERNLVSSAKHDFYLDPSPTEAVRATCPLQDLISRICALLLLFPGNEVLLAVVRVADKVLKLDIHLTPLGKVMSGLEIILRHAQDWEQHASEKVKLGEPLFELRQIASSWRKLELSCWSDLLCAREERFAQRGRTRWLSFYWMFTKITDSLETTIRTDDEFETGTPRWCWKGIHNVSSRLSRNLPQAPEILAEMLKTMDTFLLASPLGEFHVRLEVVKAFAAQAEVERQIFVARSLNSLWTYYADFASFLSERLQHMRRPFQDRLKEEVKLAKWDDQTYYAAVEASERNRRKLMRILREYDEVLGTTISTLLEKELGRGIRELDDDAEQVCPRIPSDTVLFSFSGGKDEAFCTQVGRHVNTQHVWTSASATGLPKSRHSGKLELYTRRLDSFVNTRTNRFNGTQVVTELCDSIFNRIESLRAEATTRPMKERALVDLFKELKCQGYKTTKWSIPNELRQMSEVFCLPIPKLGSLLSKAVDPRGITSCEQYFFRCLAESARFSAEVDVLGSKHVTRRQLEMMRGVADHGQLLVSQQRTMLSCLLFHRSAIQPIVAALLVDKSLLPFQSSRLKSYAKFSENYITCMNVMNELLLFLQSSTRLMQGTSKDWITSVVVTLKDYIDDAPKGVLDSPVLMTSTELNSAQERCGILTRGRRILSEWSTTCVKLECLPANLFGSCQSQFERAIALHDLVVHPPATACSEHKVDPDFFRNRVDCLVDAVLLASQHQIKASKDHRASEPTKGCNEDSIEDSGTILGFVKDGAMNWSVIDLRRIRTEFEALLDMVIAIHDQNDTDEAYRVDCVRVSRDLAYLVSKSLALLDSQLREHVSFYRGLAKLQYVLLRVFRVLAAKGFCSSKSSEGDGGDNDTAQDASGMTFEDEGTGMGEGDGSIDVTDQIEDEEQLLGLQNEKQEDTADKDPAESKQLDKEEADTGMEMEGEFDGDMHDLPEDQKDQVDGSEDENEEEVDREMGDGGGPNEEVIDEKLWGDSDEEDETGDSDEKLERDSMVKDEKPTDELTTNEKQNQGDDAESRPDAENGVGKSDEDDVSDADETNDDRDDKYEEKQGVNVRDEEKLDNADGQQPDEMELDDDLSVDEEDSGDSMSDDVETKEEVKLAQDDSSAAEDFEAPTEENEPDDTIDEQEEPADTTPEGVTSEDLQALDEGEESKKEEDTEYGNVSQKQRDNPRPGLGVRDAAGTDLMDDTGDLEEDDQGESMAQEEDGGGASQTNNAPTGEGQSDGGAGGNMASELSKGEPETHQDDEIPNPLKSPGDASKFWHKKLNVANSSLKEETGDLDQTDSSNEVAEGSYEYSGENQANTSQALGESEDNDGAQLEDKEDEGEDAETSKSETETPQHDEGRPQGTKLQKKQRTDREKPPDLDSDDMEVDELPLVEENCDGDNDSTQFEESDSESSLEHHGEEANRVVSDPSQLRSDNVKGERSTHLLVEDEQITGISSSEISEAHAKWSLVTSATHNLSRRLCERLRLVMEPLVASRLRGDYRTGKRINMKRVIGFIASGYRKDKIWLRRTKPAKRNYRVLVAVDDSESMLKGGAGDMALKAMATLSVGMSQLEIGEIGVASFGDSMRLLHPFDQPFTSSRGAEIVRQFRFNQQRTRTALCVESALKVLQETHGDRANMQLVFMISDGRIERDSRATIRRLMREMVAQNILMVLIIVEGRHEKNSIVNMKEVSFEKGKPNVKNFIDDYPFPYYILLNEIQSLPEVLCGALRQWFEMLARQQSA